MASRPRRSPEPWTLVEEDSDSLLDQVNSDGGFTGATLETAQELLERLSASGHITRTPLHRRILKAKLAYWAAQLRMETETFIPTPRLLPAGQGTGMTLLDANTFAEKLLRGEDVCEFEVQGARLVAGSTGKHRTRFCFTGSFALGSEFKGYSLDTGIAMGGASLVSSRIVSVDTPSVAAKSARFLLARLENFEVGVRGAQFTRVRMPWTEIVNSQLAGARFDDANLGGDGQIDDQDRATAEDYGLMVPVSGGATRFVGVDLRGASFSGGTYLRGTLFEECNLAGATFSGSSLADTIFRNCTFEGSEFNGAYDVDRVDESGTRGTSPGLRASDAKAGAERPSP